VRAILAALSFLLCAQAQAACTPGQGQWTINATSAVFKVCPADGSDWKTVGDSAAAAGATLPSGMIAAFNAACPTGWTELTAARGRVIVGVPASGTLAGTVGTALTDLQDKTHSHTYTEVVNHTHTVSVTDPGHTHLQRSQTATTGGVSSWEHGVIDTSSTAAETLATDSATTGITATTANPAGGVATGTTSTKATSDVIAYIQYRYCSKD
jgi:hypothetical protein